MINSEPLHSGATTSGASVPTFDKQLPGVTRKTALRDVQNQKSSLMSNHQENSHFLGARSIADPTRVCGTKRLTPERPSNGTNEHILNARRRFELELGTGRVQNNVDKFLEATHSKNLCQLQRVIPQKQNQQREDSNGHPPVAMSNHLTPMMTFSHGGPSLPNSLGKAAHNFHAAQMDSSKFSPEPVRTLDVKVDDQQLTEHFIRLQKFLKQCDEKAKQTDYIQMLLRLSPAELSRHAVDLEKRAIQLTIEEGKEMQRVKTLNVLGKSALFTNLTQTVPLVPTKK
ncbi:uncharacterized protein LOC132033014 [Lycium ferocissimum]|uniref:uncharacterized protein LOC132033014 n=1 Tax=Lycium ferocissimum TaxID=112874 RepID=UPI0028150F85|nr:uncharacterized protein LOC132033014 [Lycium ferocissimum]XP_059278841.1 uncharacterized protein LOC132033014 [Lycium ferocissimum]